MGAGRTMRAIDAVSNELSQAGIRQRFDSERLKGTANVARNVVLNWQVA
jgi:hypothetical protein